MICSEINVRFKWEWNEWIDRYIVMTDINSVKRILLTIS